ncbi:MAG: GNAT family N-acetyltransferase [Thermoguttaceae bacterium]
MSIIIRKLKSALEFIWAGDYKSLIARTLSFLHIPTKWFSIGEVFFFSLQPDVPFHSFLSEYNQRLTFSFADKTSADIIIPKLSKCMGDDTTSYPWIRPEDRADKFQTLFNRGGVVWTATDIESGDVAGFFWTTSKEYHAKRGNTELVINLPSDNVFIEFIYVGREFRRFGVYTHLLMEARQNFPNTIFSCMVEPDNTPSIKAQLKNGYHRAGGVTYVVFFGLIFASFLFHGFRKCFFRVPSRRPYYIDMSEKRV